MEAFVRPVQRHEKGVNLKIVVGPIYGYIEKKYYCLKPESRKCSPNLKLVQFQITPLKFMTISKSIIAITLLHRHITVETQLQNLQMLTTIKRIQIFVNQITSGTKIQRKFF